MSGKVTTPLRLPAELHAKLKELAAADGRSFNAYIARRLAQMVGPEVRVSMAVIEAERRGAGVAARPVQAAHSVEPLEPGQKLGGRVGKARPNERCTCGSGVKYKRCHGRATA